MAPRQVPGQHRRRSAGAGHLGHHVGAREDRADDRDHGHTLAGEHGIAGAVEALRGRAGGGLQVEAEPVLALGGTAIGTAGPVQAREARHEVQVVGTDRPRLGRQGVERADHGHSSGWVGAGDGFGGGSLPPGAASAGDAGLTAFRPSLV